MNRKKSYLIIAIIGIIWMVYLGMNKYGYHQDEVFSYLLANNAFEGTKFTGEIGWHTPDYYLNMVTVSTEESLNVKSVISNQINDVHPPLYYLVLHFVSWLFKGIFSKWIGLSINVVFSLIVTFLIYEVSLLFVKNNTVPLVLSLYYLLSNGGASNYLFIRMYLMLTIFTVLLTYQLIKLLKDGWSSKHLKLYSLVLILGGLTHYYFYIYAFFLTLFSCIYLLIGREIKKTLIFGLSALGSVLATFAIYPWVIEHVFNSGRGEEVLEGFTSSFLNIGNIKAFFKLVSEQLFGGLLFLCLFLIIIGILGTMFKKKGEIKTILASKRTKIYFVILSATVLTLYVIAQVSPYKEGRYMYAIYPILVLVILLPIYILMSLWVVEKQAKQLFVVFASIITLLGFNRFSPEHIFTYMEENQNYLNKLGIENALIISESPYKEAAQIHELQQFDNIYRLFDFDLSQLPVDETLSNEPMVVYIDSRKIDSEEFREQLKEQYTKNDFQFLYRHIYHNVYVVY